MDISMDIHGKSVDMDMDMDGKFHIHGKPDRAISLFLTTVIIFFWESTYQIGTCGAG